MKTKAVLFGALILGVSTSVADAGDLVAGPLSATLPDGVVCKVVNISATPKPVAIHVLGADGQILFQSSDPALRAGRTLVVGGAVSGQAYCKFVGATAVSFRGSIANFNAGTGGSDFATLPAR